ncbi:hypothetical protein NEF87_000635 [Candidatus Lokiarchaeum ossiferum]|uniref:HTH merR-type domain-containing protein n=1 Tax=Candidatus Lokiarchaeum ossiferum TaxID=2951803 RepID=A0ABY6HLG9_9ARCH|nr:hypothetical protein NEF87_000635 [Candidatus Lokiarchaeum sp. B-35]
MGEQIQINIGRFSKICQLTPKALRIYEKKGILKPKIVDDLTGYRYYSNDQIHRGIILSKLAWAKFSLKEMEEYLDFYQEEDFQSAESILKKKINELEEQQAQISLAKRFLSKIVEKDYFTIQDERIQIKMIPELRVVSKHAIGIYGDTIPRLIGEIYKYIFQQPNQELIRISGPTIFLSFDEEFKEFDADIEIAIPVTGPIKSSDEIKVKKLQTAMMATILHTGPYEEVNEAYGKILLYIQKKKWKIVGPSREVYLNSPQTASPEELLTEIQFPVEINPKEQKK